MRVLLRNRRTRHFYAAHSPSLRGNGSGAAKPQALDFGNVRNAAKFTLERRLPDMEIVLRYDSCEGEVALPVLPEWCLIGERALGPSCQRT